MQETKTIISKIGILCLISIVTLLTLVSCGGGGDDDLGAPQTGTNVSGGSDMVAITFSGSEGREDAVTRAAGTPLNEKATSFQVWGHKDMSYSAGAYGGMQTVFPGYTVSWVTNTAYTTTSNTNDWEYVGGDQTIKFWDWSAKAYRFFAVTDWGTSSGAGGTYGPSNIYQSYNISMPADCSGTTKDEIAANIAATPYFSRLWFSTGVPADYPDKQFGKPVQLEFLKPYARVRFIFKYTYPREGIKLEDITFKPTSAGSKIVRKGTFTVIYPLTGTATAEWFEMTPNSSDDPDVNKALNAFEEDFDPEDDTKEYSADCPGGWYTVLPNNTQGSYTLSAKVNGANKTAVVPADYMQWLPGYSYTYIFKITEEGGIEIGWVEYAMTPWTEQTAPWKVYNW